MQSRWVGERADRQCCGEIGAGCLCVARKTHVILGSNAWKQEFHKAGRSNTKIKGKWESRG